MSFPTVKSDPYRKRRRLRRRWHLWSAEFWRRLVAQAERDADCASWLLDRADDPDLISESCLEMIREMNLTLYGKA